MPAAAPLALAALLCSPALASPSHRETFDRYARAWTSGMSEADRELWYSEWTCLASRLDALEASRRRKAEVALAEFIESYGKFRASLERAGSLTDWQPAAGYLSVMTDRLRSLERATDYPSWRLRALFVPEDSCPVRCGFLHPYPRELARELRKEPFLRQAEAAAAYCAAHGEYDTLLGQAATLANAAAADRGGDPAPYCTWLAASLAAGNRRAFAETVRFTLRLDPENPFLHWLGRDPWAGKGYDDLGVCSGSSRRPAAFVPPWLHPDASWDAQAWTPRQAPQGQRYLPEPGRGPQNDSWEIDVRVLPSEPGPKQIRPPAPRRPARPGAHQPTTGLTPTPPSALPSLLAALRRGERNERLHAVNDLGNMGLPALGALGEALGDGDWEVRLTAVHWLGRLGPAGADGLGRAMRDDPCRLVRLTAVHWLGSLGPEYFPEVSEALEDPSPSMRQAGRYWSHRLRRPGRHVMDEGDDGPAASGEDLSRCERMDIPPWRPAPADLARARAPDASAPPEPAQVPEGRLPEPARRVNPRLAGNLDPDPFVDPRAPAPPAAAPRPAGPARPAPDPSLEGRLGPGGERLPSPPLPRTREIDELIRSTATAPGRPAPEADLAGRLGAPERPLAPPQGPQRQEKDVSAYAAFLEGAKGPLTFDAIPVLVEILAKGSAPLRARAADELGMLGPAAAKAAPALRRALKDGSRRVRASAALALGDIGTAAGPALDDLVAALRDPDPDVRYSAALGLGRMGTPRAQNAFLRYQREEQARASSDR